MCQRRLVAARELEEAGQAAPGRHGRVSRSDLSMPRSDLSMPLPPKEVQDAHDRGIDRTD